MISARACPFKSIFNHCNLIIISTTQNPQNNNAQDEYDIQIQRIKLTRSLKCEY